MLCFFVCCGVVVLTSPDQFASRIVGPRFSCTANEGHPFRTADTELKALNLVATERSVCVGVSASVFKF